MVPPLFDTGLFLRAADKERFAASAPMEAGNFGTGLVEPTEVLVLFMLSQTCVSAP